MYKRFIRGSISKGWREREVQQVWRPFRPWRRWGNRGRRKWREGKLAGISESQAALLKFFLGWWRVSQQKLPVGGILHEGGMAIVASLPWPFIGCERPGGAVPSEWMSLWNQRCGIERLIQSALLLKGNLSWACPWSWPHLIIQVQWNKRLLNSST